MDTMERYKLRTSIQDVIAILDSSPIQADLMPERNLVQLTNRIPIAHLAIERGLKATIRWKAKEKQLDKILDWLDDEKGGKTHILRSLYTKLKEVDQELANFLSLAFNDAVQFYGYNVNRKGFKHFRSLEDYFSTVASGQVFEAMRYWVIEGTSDQEAVISLISPAIHREILCALQCIFLSGLWQTVSQRVEHQVREAMWRMADLAYGSNDKAKEELVKWYFDWLTKEHTSFSSALETAIQQQFDVKNGDDFIVGVLRAAWNDLQSSKDPAVRYFIHTLAYLPKGSQQQDPNAIPEIEWIRKDHFGKVNTPAGTCLGFVEKLPDGAWAIEPLEEGMAGVKAVAWRLKDAKNFLVNRLTAAIQVTVTGESRHLIVVGKRSLNPDISWSGDMESAREMLNRPHPRTLEFWDKEHNLAEGDSVSLVTPPEGENKVVTVLEGTVTSVDAQKVTIEGNARLDLWKAGA